jgi:riboflavin kinase/FMN adenylyltransferase
MAAKEGILPILNEDKYIPMQHFRSFGEVNLADVWLTIGSFDGVHKGHTSILHELILGAKEDELPAVVITFFPHPATILRGRNFPYYLTSLQEKAEIMKGIGIDVLITHPFNRRVANKSANQFVGDIQRHMKIRHLQVGYDFAMGKNRGGDFSTLKTLGRENGFTVKRSGPIEFGGDVISSSRIRFLLGVGQVQQAASLLGREYEVTGIVEVGDKRGRELGFPTANLSVWHEKIIPTAGVYACWAKTLGEKMPAVTNIGVRPTFESTPVSPRVETHLLDFDQEIYGERIQLEFVDRIRDEQKFTSIEDLTTQIQKDLIEARRLLGT